MPTIGLVGVQGWSQKRAKDASADTPRELLDDLAAVVWQNREVFICYDSDAATNDNVALAERQLAEALGRAGAKVKIVRLPEVVDALGNVIKVGLDDFLIGRGVDALHQLMLDAEDPKSVRADYVLEAGDDPDRLARIYLAQQGRDKNGLLTLRFWRDEWWQHGEGCYRAVPDSEVRAHLHGVSKREADALKKALAEWMRTGQNDKPPTAFKITRTLIGNVAQAVGSMTVLRSRIDAPAWIDGPALYPADEMLAASNGLVHLPSCVAGRPGYFVEHTPGFFGLNVLDYPFDSGAPKPVEWLKFLETLWRNDQQSIHTLQEWLGYLLTRDTSQQKIMLYVGPRRSGKGTIARIQTALLGRENVVGPTLSSLATNFGLQPLLNKFAAIISDARLGGRTDAVAVTERLLAISGEDAITVDRKNMVAVTAKLGVRFTVLTNEMPRLMDASGALASRLIVLRLTESFYGREDTALSTRLREELPGVLLWAIAGWVRLRQRGHFVQPESGRELIETMEDLSSPVGAFLKECCDLGVGQRVEVRELFNAWKTWCEGMGREPSNQQTLGRDLHAAVPILKTSQARLNGLVVRIYEGIGLKPLP